MQRSLLLLVFALAPALVGAAPYRPLPIRPVEETGAPRVVFDTNHGKIVVELYADKAPITVKNFLQYVDDGYYDGVIFHRVIPNFMIQGGGFRTGFVEKKTREPIKNEAANGLSNDRGTISVARTAVPDSGTAQFFINHANNHQLNQANAPDKVGYCVFGRVVEGMEVVDRIAQVATGAQGVHQNVPTAEVVIRTARRVGF